MPRATPYTSLDDLVRRVPGLTLAQLEAMAAGLPLVTTHTSPAEDLLTPDGAVFVPTGDTGAAEDGRRRLAGHLQNLAVPDRWSRVLSTTYSCDVPKTLAGEELDLDDGPARDAALFLVDGNNLAYRAFFALPVENFSTTTGQATNAVYGFTTMLVNLVKEHRPDGVVVVFDRPEPTFRHEAIPEYKAQREKAPETLRSQLGIIRELLDVLGIKWLEMAGFEGDDLIVHGSPEECAAHVRRYAANGITTPAPMILAGPDDAMRVARALAPGA